MLRLLALSVMAMMFGLFSMNWMAGTDDIERMIRGVILCTFAVTLFSLRGSRELIVFFGLPLLVMLAVMKIHGQPILSVLGALFDPLMMFLIAVLAAEMLYRTWLSAFIANQKLAERAATDPLTGLSNRRSIEPQLAGETASANRHDSTFSILMADLDHFKHVNDTYGHDIGDEVLREVARRMRAMLRTEDRAVRWGGEEFMVLLTDTSMEQASVVAEKLRRTIAEESIECNGLDISITISIGVAEHCGEHDALDIIRRADRALYRAKHEGRNRVCVDGESRS
ncbi:MAG: GGDEF domain-containing protein [Wenzhouxiangella sp.]|nr:MAG: GGDEF domain-containing protein [Wenzhouxiangella sp.]